MRMQVCCKSLALPTRATEPPVLQPRGIMLWTRTDIAAASADAVASPAALRLRQPPQEAANLYSIHASVIDHALPRIASHRRASPARPAGFHGTQHAPQPPRRTQRTYVYILLRPNPRAHMHTRTRLALAQSRTSSTCALSCHWTELRAMPVSQQCCAPFSLCRHLPSSHNRRAHSRYARDSLSHVESCRARARARGWWAASLPRSLARSQDTAPDLARLQGRGASADR